MKDERKSATPRTDTNTPQVSLNMAVSCRLGGPDILLIVAYVNQGQKRKRFHSPSITKRTVRKLAPAPVKEREDTSSFEVRSSSNKSLVTSLTREKTQIALKLWKKGVLRTL